MAVNAQVRTSRYGLQVKTNSKSNTSKDKKEQFDAIPSPVMLRQYYDCGYSIAEASNDITDNASPDQLASRIYYWSGMYEGLPYYTVADNGLGMTKPQLKAMIRLGASSDKINQRDLKVDRGRFHIGAKASIGTFQCRALILTKTKDGRIWKLVFDIEEMIKNDSWKLEVNLADEKEVELFFKKLNKKPTDTNVSGTVIHMTRIQAYKSPESKAKTIKKVVGQTFREDIYKGKKFYMNGVEIEPIDPMAIETPAVWKGKTFRGKRWASDKYTNVKYYDSNGVLHKDGYIELIYYKLDDLGWDKAIARDLGYNAQNSGIYVMRQDREIAAAYRGSDTKPLFPFNSETARLRVLMRYKLGTDFGMDREVGIPYLKNKVSFSEDLQNLLRRDMAQKISQFREEYKIEKEARKKLKTTTASTKWSERKVMDIASSIRSLLPPIPNVDLQLPPITSIDEFIDNGSKDLYEVKYVSLGELACPFGGHLIKNGQSKIVLMINKDHPLYKEFLNNDDMSQRSKFCIYSLITAVIHAKWSNLPINTEKAQLEYEQKWRSIESSIGNALYYLLGMKPDIFDLNDD